MDIDPRDILKLAKTESSLWAEAHISLAQRVTQSREVDELILPSISGQWGSRMDHRKRRTIIQDKIGITRWKV